MPAALLVTDYRYSNQYVHVHVLTRDEEITRG